MHRDPLIELRVLGTGVEGRAGAGGGAAVLPSKSAPDAADIVGLGREATVLTIGRVSFALPESNDNETFNGASYNYLLESQVTQVTQTLISLPLPSP